MEGSSVQTLFSRAIVFRNSPFGVDAWRSSGAPAAYTGRFHRKGEPLPLYGSDSIHAALGELALHTEEPLEPGREVLRRITAVAIADYARSLPRVAAISTQSNAEQRQRTLAVLPEHLGVTGLVDYWEGSLNLLRLAFIEQPRSAGRH